MTTLLAGIAIASIWMVSAILSLSAKEATQITKDTVAGAKDIHSEWNKAA